MTREKIIEILERKSSIPNDGETWDEIDNAYNEAIKILKQEPVLDKIRAEIINIHLTDTDGHSGNWYREPQAIINDVLQIIDRYKAESEDRE